MSNSSVVPHNIKTVIPQALRDNMVYSMNVLVMGKYRVKSQHGDLSIDKLIGETGVIS